MTQADKNLVALGKAMRACGIAGTQVLVVNHESYRSECCSIHALGCGDIEKDLDRQGGFPYGPFASAADATADFLACMEVDFGPDVYTAHNIRVCPCCK
jgi:hypothetical protein